MKIKKYTKLKNGKYKAHFDNGDAIILYDDVIIKHNLLGLKNLDGDILNIIREDNIFYNYYNLAFKYIIKRLRSKKEMINYLEKNNVDHEMIDKIIEKLVSSGMINDKLFTQSFYHDKISLTNWGIEKIKRELLNYGIDEEIIATIKSENDDDRIKAIIKKQMKINKKYSGFILKQRIMNYLVNLGYRKEDINKHLSNIDMSIDEASYEKEYKKIKKQLEKKYSGDILEYKIKNKLYKQGFMKEIE